DLVVETPALVWPKRNIRETLQGLVQLRIRAAQRFNLRDSEHFKIQIATLGSSIRAADDGEGIRLGPRHELGEREPRTHGVGAKLKGTASGQHVCKLLKVARIRRTERPGAECGDGHIAR